MYRVAVADFKPAIFGRYYLTELLARGGMAELYRAKLFGAGGFEKTIALKRVLPQFADDQNFLTMLTDEARLTVALSHPNIVQLFDFGRVENDYFIAMELVDGVDLNRLLQRLYELQLRVPAEIACFIMSEALRGLQHAHTLKDGAGKPLAIVHRDVSPQNVLLSLNGEVKITDFGIAKAASNITQTQTGMIKGKVAYLSPEQAEGKALDGRTDVFAAGLVFYQLLTGRLLFDGDSQLEIMGKIKATYISEDALPSSIPTELRQILARALAHDVDKRYASAGEFQKDIQKFMAAHYPGVTSETLAEFLAQIFPEKIRERETRLEVPIDPQLRAELAAHSGGMAALDAGTEVMGDTEVIPAAQKTVTGAVLASARRIWWPLFGVSFLLFFFADFFKPLLSLSPIFFLLSAGVGATLYFSSIKRYLTANPLSRVLRSKVGEGFVFALLSVVVWGMATIISAFTPSQGLLAATIPPVGTLQEQILRIRSDVAGIKSDIARLEKSAAIVLHPQTAQDFWHNARQYQVQGKTEEAMAAYAEFLRREPGMVDAHEAYQALLKTRQGEAAVKIVYQKMAVDRPDSPIVAAMAARLQPEAERIAALDALLQKYSSDPYLIYERLKVYLDRGLGFLSTNEWIKAKQLYDDLVKQGIDKVLKVHLLDSEALQKAQQGLAAFDVMYAQFGSLRAKNPITINHEQYQDSVSITIFPQEPELQKILYSVDSPSQFEETGIEPTSIDSHTGKPNVRYQVSLKINPGKHILYAKYVDSKGVESAVKEYPFEIFSFSVSLDPKASIPGSRESSVDLAIKPLQGMKVQGFEYSVDNESLGQKVEGTRTTLKGLSKGSHILHIRSRYADGTISNVMKTPFYAP